MNQEIEQLPLKKNREDFLDSKGFPEPTITRDGIFGFFGGTRYLSNFEPCLIRIGDRVFKNSEAAYMAEKTNDEAQKDHLQHLTGPEAKKYGQTVTLRDNWDSVKYDAMKKVVKAKFTQNHNLRLQLLITGDKYLEETNWWKDRYWGVWDGIGLNCLGTILMEVRSELIA